MEKNTVQLNVRVGRRTRRTLEEIAEAEDVRVSELVRGWIREKVRAYQHRKAVLEVEREMSEG